MLYISYGSNMNIDQMAFRCPNATIYGNGKLIGWKLVFNIHADIIETGNEEDSVPVVVWNLDDEHDLASLDMYEGFPKYYTKIIVNAIMDSGETVRAMVYVMTDERKGIAPPSAVYFDGIKAGYLANGIDLKPLYKAMAESCARENQTKYNQYNPRLARKVNYRWR